MKQIPLVLLLACALSACGESETEMPQNSAQVTKAIERAEAVRNSTLEKSKGANVEIDHAAGPHRTEAKTADYNFRYSYPAAAARIVPLREWLDEDRASLQASVKSDSAQHRKSMAAGGFPFHPYDSTTEWRVVTETPGLLSLSATIYSFTGGAHGSPGFRALVWDKEAGKRMLPTDLFVSADALQAALGERFCRVLDRSRAQRRGAAVVRSSDPFNGCPKVAETTLILGSTDRRAIDRVGLLIDPYVAGPYAEGTYDLTLRVTPEVLAAVKPEYRELFIARDAPGAAPAPR